MTGIVLVHGAWHGAWGWDGVVADRAERGLATDAVTLPLTGADDDVAAARSAIEAAGPDCVVVGHSYGAMAISGAPAGLPVRHLVYLAACMPEPGEPMLTLLDGSQLNEAVVLEDGRALVEPTLAAAIFYATPSPRWPGWVVQPSTPSSFIGRLLSWCVVRSSRCTGTGRPWFA